MAAVKYILAHLPSVEDLPLVAIHAALIVTISVTMLLGLPA